MAPEESFGIIPLSKEEGVWRVFLILHKGGKHWAFPKGHSNPGETPLDTAKRELREETGLEVVSLLESTPFVENYQFRRHGKLVHKRVHYFPALVAGKEYLQAEEIVDGKWLSLEQALHVLTFHEAKEICREIIKYVASI